MTESESQIVTTGQVQTNTATQYNFTLTLTGQLAVSAQQTEDESDQENVQDTVEAS
jgi:hypothetical protein